MSRSGGVGDDGVEAAAQEHFEIVSRQVAGHVANTSVRRERAAAELARGDNDLATIRGQDADRRFVELREGDLGNAACEEGHAGAALPLRRKRFPKVIEEEGVVDARHQAFAVGQAEKAEDSSSAGEALEAGALVEANEPGREGNALGMREEPAIGEMTREAGEQRPAVVLLDLAAGVFDELAVLDARGAGGLAGAAVEALVDVPDIPLTGQNPELFHVKHLADPATGGVGFEAPEAVGGAVVQAEAAVDTAGEILVGWLVTDCIGRNY